MKPVNVAARRGKFVSKRHERNEAWIGNATLVGRHGAGGYSAVV